MYPSRKPWHRRGRGSVCLLWALTLEPRGSERALRTADADMLEEGKNFEVAVEANYVDRIMYLSAAFSNCLDEFHFLSHLT